MAAKHLSRFVASILLHIISSLVVLEAWHWPRGHHLEVSYGLDLGLEENVLALDRGLGRGQGVTEFSSKILQLFIRCLYNVFRHGDACL